MADRSLLESILAHDPGWAQMDDDRKQKTLDELSTNPRRAIEVFSAIDPMFAQKKPEDQLALIGRVSETPLVTDIAGGVKAGVGGAVRGVAGLVNEFTGLGRGAQDWGRQVRDENIAPDQGYVSSLVTGVTENLLPMAAAAVAPEAAVLSGIVVGGAQAFGSKAATDLEASEPAGIVSAESAVENRMRAFLPALGHGIVMGGIGAPAALAGPMARTAEGALWKGLTKEFGVNAAKDSLLLPTATAVTMAIDAASSTGEFANTDWNDPKSMDMFKEKVRDAAWESAKLAPGFAAVGVSTAAIGRARAGRNVIRAADPQEALGDRTYDALKSGELAQDTLDAQGEANLARPVEARDASQLVIPDSELEASGYVPEGPAPIMAKTTPDIRPLESVTGGGDIYAGTDRSYQIQTPEGEVRLSHIGGERADGTPLAPHELKAFETIAENHGDVATARKVMTERAVAEAKIAIEDPATTGRAKQLLDSADAHARGAEFLEKTPPTISGVETTNRLGERAPLVKYDPATLAKDTADIIKDWRDVPEIKLNTKREEARRPDSFANYVPGKGDAAPTIEVNGFNIRSKAELRHALVHENLAHYGLDKMTAESPKLRAWVVGGTLKLSKEGKPLYDLANGVRERYKDSNLSNDQLAHEIFAEYVAQYNPQVRAEQGLKGWWEGTKFAMKKFVAKHFGFTPEMSDADYHQMARSATRSVIENPNRPKFWSQNTETKESKPFPGKPIPNGVNSDRKNEKKMLKITPERKDLKGEGLKYTPVTIVRDTPDGVVVRHETHGELIVDNKDLHPMDPALSDDLKAGPAALKPIAMVRWQRALLDLIRVGEARGLRALQILTKDSPTMITLGGKSVKLNWALARHPELVERYFASEGLGHMIDTIMSVDLPAGAQKSQLMNQITKVVGASSSRLGLEPDQPRAGEPVNELRKAHLSMVSRVFNEYRKKGIDAGTVSIEEFTRDVKGRLRNAFGKNTGLYTQHLSPESKKAASGSAMAEIRIWDHMNPDADRATRAEVMRNFENNELFERSLTVDTVSEGIMRFELDRLADFVHGARYDPTKKNMAYHIFLGAYINDTQFKLPTGNWVRAIDHFAPEFSRVFESYKTGNKEFVDTIEKLRGWQGDPEQRIAYYKAQMADANRRAIAEFASRDASDATMTNLTRAKQILSNRYAPMLDQIRKLAPERAASIEDLLQRTLASTADEARVVDGMNELLTRHFGKTPELIPDLDLWLVLNHIAEGGREKVIKYDVPIIDPVTGEKSTVSHTEKVDLASTLGLTPEQARIDRDHMDPSGKYEAFRKEYTALRERTSIAAMQESTAFGKAMIKTATDRKNYVTMNPVGHIAKMNPGHTSFVGKLHEQFGSYKAVASSIEATMLKDTQIIHFAKLNMLKSSAIDVLKADPKLAIPAPRVGKGEFAQPSSKSMALVEFLRDGKVEGWHVASSIADALDKPAGTLLASVDRVNNYFKALYTTFSIPFTFFRNPTRDFVSSVINARGGSFGSMAKEWITAMAQSLTGNIPASEKEMLAKYSLSTKFGGSMQTVDPTDGLGARLFQKYDATSKFFPKGDGQKTSFDVVRQLWDKTIGRVSDFMLESSARIEAAPKLAAYRHYEKQTLALKAELDKRVAAGTLTQGEADIQVERKRAEGRIRTRTEAGTPFGLYAGDMNKFTKNFVLFGNIAIQGWITNVNAVTNGQINPMKWNGEVLLKRTAATLTVNAIRMAIAYGFTGDDNAAAMDRIPWTDQANYLCIPLGTVYHEGMPELGAGKLSPQGLNLGKTLYMRIPLDETTRLMNSLAFQMSNSRGGHEMMVTAARGIYADVPSKSPVVQLLATSLGVMQGYNPTDMSSGLPVFNKNVWDAGGYEIGKEYLRQFTNTALPLQSVYRIPSEDAKNTKGWFEKQVGTPIADRVWAAFFGISDQGISDRVRHLGKDRIEEQAKIRLMIARATKADPSSGALQKVLSGARDLTPVQQQWLAKNGAGYIKQAMRSNWANQQDDPFIREYLAADQPGREALVDYYYNSKRRTK